MQFHPEERQVISSSQDGCVFVWHFRPQLRPYRFVGHKGEIHDLSVNSTGQLIASASADRTVRLWANSPQGDSQVMKVHTAAVRSVCFSRDDALLLTASDDKTVKLWQVSSMRFQGSLVGHTHWVYSAAFSKTADLVASGGEDRSVRVWDVEKKAVIVSFQDIEAPISKVRFHPDGAFLAAASHDGCVNIWDLRSRRLLQHYDAHAGGVLGMDFHPNGDHLATCSEDEMLKIWDLREGRLLYKALGSHQRPLAACAFAPTGRSLVTGGRDSMVVVWDCSGDAAATDAPGYASAGTASASPGRRASSRPSRVATATGRATGSQRLVQVPAAEKLHSAGRATVTTSVPEVQYQDPSSASPPQPLQGPSPGPQAAAQLPSTALWDGVSADLPPALAQTLHRMQSHLEIMARTIQLLDRRLAMTEKQVVRMHQELLQCPTSAAGPALREAVNA